MSSVESDLLASLIGQQSETPNQRVVDYQQGYYDGLTKAMSLVEGLLKDNINETGFRALTEIRKLFDKELHPPPAI